jgi:hypothetical protein
VWLVQDGSTLYVDRNGNGDLTENNKAVAASEADVSEGTYEFHAGEVSVGGHRHKDLLLSVSRIDFLVDQDEHAKALLARDPKARGYHLSIELELPGWKGRGIGGRVREHNYYADGNGVLQLGDRPEEAPIIHFGGSWQVTLFDTLRLTVDREKDMVLGVGTPGLGPGTTAYVDYEGVIPEGIYPTVEITYPPGVPGGPQIFQHYELKRRC